MWHEWEITEARTGFWLRDHMENLGVHGRIILKMDVQEVVWGGVDWIDLAYGRDTWRVHVIAELNHPVK
jgi:hypothetical protein